MSRIKALMVLPGAIYRTLSDLTERERRHLRRRNRRSAAWPVQG